MSYRGTGQLIPPVAPIADLWYQRKARELQVAAASIAGFGEVATPTPSAIEPPPAREPKYGLMIGWGSVVLIAGGIFYAATQGTGTKRVRANRHRRRSRSSRRRASRRRSSYRMRRNSRSSGIAYRVYTSPTSRIQIGKTFSTRADAERYVRGSRASGRAPKATIRTLTLRANVRRGGKRRTSKRRSSIRRYKALSAASRKRMPESSFALPGRRFPIAGPPGSSRERDKWQALQAIRYLNMGRIRTKRDYLAIRNAIIRKYGPGFWRSYDGPTWPKIIKAKRKRATTRRRRTPRRRLAANRRTSRRSR